MLLLYTKRAGTSQAQWRSRYCMSRRQLLGMSKLLQVREATRIWLRLNEKGISEGFGFLCQHCENIVKRMRGVSPVRCERVFVAVQVSVVWLEIHESMMMVRVEKGCVAS